MKKTGAFLVRHALEQIGVQFTFGIPGVHNTELYDELAKSDSIEPILVTHEGGAAFMADAVSRVSNSIGTLLVVPAAGLTHAMSGIGEAFLDGIPMLVLSGGVRSDSKFQYQLHELDQQQLLQAVTKHAWKIREHKDIIPTIFDAYRVATSGEPGPVYIEIPVNIQLDTGEVAELPLFARSANEVIDQSSIQQAAALLAKAKKPALFVGWGAVNSSKHLIALAEWLGAPVSTTLQGLSAFPGNHPLHCGFSFGPHAVPAANQAFDDCDCLLAIGTRFGEIATGSYGIKVPEQLIHIDINPEVFSKNYPAKVTIEGDASLVLPELIAALKSLDQKPRNNIEQLIADIATSKAHYLEEWLQHDSVDRINPGMFFQSLRQQLPDDAFIVCDDGNHTFLTAELMPIYQPKHFISPTDFNCMGYAVPASIGVKLSHPDKPVFAIIGDGAFLMTGMEMLTAVRHQLGMVLAVFNDGELSQISQAQQIPYNRKVCTVLTPVQFKGMADTVGAHYVELKDNKEIESVIAQCLTLANQNKVVLLDVRIDYSKKTRFTTGVVGTNIKRLPMNTKLRMIGRSLWRKVTG